MEGNCVEGRGQRSGPGESMGSLWLAGSLSRGEGSEFVRFSPGGSGAGREGVWELRGWSGSAPA